MESKPSQKQSDLYGFSHSQAQSASTGPRLTSMGPGPVPGASIGADCIDPGFAGESGSAGSRDTAPANQARGYFIPPTAAPTMTLSDASFPSSGGGQKMKFFVDPSAQAESEIPVEEKKLEEQFNMLSFNQPKSSKLEHYQAASGGSFASNGCNLGKNFPQLQRVEIGQGPNPIHQKHHHHNQEAMKFAGGAGGYNSHPFKEEESGSSSGTISSRRSSQPKPKKSSSQTESVIAALAHFTPAEAEQVFVMHYDPLRANMLVLTEKQFSLIRSIYPQAFAGNQWNLGDDQAKQMLLNLRALYLATVRKNNNNYKR